MTDADRYEDMHLWLMDGSISRPADYIGERCSWAIGNPALVMRIDGTWDVVEFATYRRIGERLGRREAEFLVSVKKAYALRRRDEAAKVERSLRGLR